MTRPLNRGRFLKSAGAATALALAGCGTGEEQGASELSQDTDAASFPPVTPTQAPRDCAIHSFFTAAEARTVSAIAGRLIPGTPADPGAREACVPTYIDLKLAQFPAFATPTYHQPPFAKPVDAGPVPEDQRSADTILVLKSELPRYGFQSDLTPQQAYRQGLAQLDAFSLKEHGAAFADLDEPTQDAILTALEAGEPAAMKEPDAAGFFMLVQNDTNEGMFADPVYGGNRDFAGWKLIGYPGAQRAWTPAELKSGPRHRHIQSLKDMPAMNPGQPAHGAILPISGTRATAHG